jgi:predicted nuclease with TOPRIM domain
MDNDLKYLIDNAIGCRNSLALAADKFVGWLEGIRDAAAKCEQDLKAKQALADAEINRRRAEIEELKDRRFKLEREIKAAKDELEKTLREHARVKKGFSDFIDEVTATKLVA